MDTEELLVQAEPRRKSNSAVHSGNGFASNPRSSLLRNANMKKGWIICVTDRNETDQAFKLELKSRTDVRDKTANLQERYNAIEANRFLVSGSCPYSEVAVEKRIRVRFRFTDVDLLEIMALIAMTDPLVISSEPESAVVEIDECFSDQIVGILTKHDVRVDQNIIV